MNDLQQAMGMIAAAAHANGDAIDENIRPQDNLNVQHSFDAFHNSNYIPIGKRRDELRFETTTLYTFLGALQRNYSGDKLAAKAGVDFASLPPEERQQAVQAALEADPREASEQHDEFAEAYSQEIEPSDTNLIRITYGEEELFNGYLLRDHICPLEESFSIAEYRRAVSKVRSIRIETTKLAHEVADVLDAAGSEELSEEPETDTERDYQPPSPGFQ